MKFGKLWLMVLAMFLAGTTQLGCGLLDKKDDEKADSDSRKKKKKKKSDDDDDSGDSDKADCPAGQICLTQDDFGYACALNPGEQSSVSLPETGEHQDPKEREVVKLVRELLSELTEPAGLPPGSVPPVFIDPKVAGNVATATFFKKDRGNYKKGQRVILFAAKEFYEHVKKSGTTDTIAFIFAHEMGHHVNGHLGQRPDQSDHSLELEADYYAGFLLGKRNTTLANATAWVRANVPEKDTRTHPGKAKRLDATTRGWKKGCAESSKKCDPNQTVDDVPSNPEPSVQPSEGEGEGEGEPEEQPEPAPARDPNMKSYSDRENQ
jgi:hypothetical protein